MDFLKNKEEIENYDEIAKVLREHGWETWYNDDNWVKTEWYDQGKNIAMMGQSTEDVYNDIINKI